MQDSRGYKYQLTYYLAWSCYHQMELLDEASQNLLEGFLNKVCTENEVVIRESIITDSYVCLILDCMPKHYIPDLLKLLKGPSARYLLKSSEYVKLHGKDGIWDNLNIVGTSDKVLEEIKSTVEKKRERRKRRKKGVCEYDETSNEEVDQ